MITITMTITNSKKILIVLLCGQLLLATFPGCDSFVQPHSGHRKQHRRLSFTVLESSSTDPINTAKVATNERTLEGETASASAPATTTTCQFCNEHFASRNALFRHLKTNRKCSQQADIQDDQQSTSKPHSLALQFSYYYNN